MKRYDLMHSINTRGTFLCTKLCLPYLKKVCVFGALSLSLSVSLSLSLSSFLFASRPP
jgi:hypothetical protein